MPSFTYTATRSLKSGHVSGTDYTITIETQRDDDDQPRGIKDTFKALDGSMTHTLHRIEQYRDIKTVPIERSGGTPDPDDFIEFFNSVAGGETFTYNDGSDHTVMMSTMPKRTRLGSLHQFYSFKLEILG